ncbi:hypothetical protein CkaCkLH20_12885 [Colletotrichum karsti]|uniref:Uncharacterized protein n=1 Tax=Colletotrichum karsti TaxID=1095194 RepID=A0A9P6LDX4_9PEZI|nr:uncharacterized protein CkaCkLH20_12885 [Colletotrichum karsti]KAF9869698.1 hypothetical protein CkaCkLH20_12885 [Colletotrichum karsti]
MQFIQIASLFAVMAASVFADANVGSSCDGNAYDCVAGGSGIAVCDGAKWQLASECGSCPNACMFPPGTKVPYCHVSRFRNGGWVRQMDAT